MRDAGRPRSLPDHMTPAGDRVRWKFDVEVVADDGSVPHSIAVIVTNSQKLGVTGSIGHEQVALDILEHAIDAVRGYHARKGGFTIPGKDVSIAGVSAREVRVTGPIEDREYAVACLENAKSAVRGHHDKRRVLTPSTADVTVARAL